jgi:hypothetical protein
MPAPESKSSIHAFCAFCSFILPGTGQLLQKRFGTAIGLFLMFVMTGIVPVTIFYALFEYRLPFEQPWWDYIHIFLLLGSFCIPFLLVILFAILDAATWKQGVKTRIPTRLIVLTIGCFFLITPLVLLPFAVNHRHVMAVQMTCKNYMKKLALGCYKYNDEHGHFPLAYSVDKQGKPLHSWRVLILPYIEEEELYKKIRLNEPWDSEYNRQFHSRAPHIFQCPAHGFGTKAVPQGSFYSMVIETDSAPDNVLPKDLLPNDCNPKDIMLAERKLPVNWMNPTDAFTLDDFAKGINVDSMGVSSNHQGGGVCCAMHDGSVLTLFGKK